jgi:methylenetetrahydrofolate/methylenetetrahydromethanopterin dehydrogenase (NADP+)
MKKLLFQLDTDTVASVFDTVVAHDGGADAVNVLCGVNPHNCKPLVEGAIYTRAPKDKKNTALFIGGSELASSQALMDAVVSHFFDGFRVSVMLDSNGCNTTAAAGVALIARAMDLKGKTAVVLAGTGPVGQRTAMLMAKAGAKVRLTSRRLDRAQAACSAMHARFGVSLTAMSASDGRSTAEALDGAHVAFGAGAAGVHLLSAAQWQSHPTLEVLADVSTEPPLGFEGLDIMDKATSRHGKLAFGGIGIGALKLKLHRACIAKLFERNDIVMDAEEVYALARTLV